MRNLFQRLMVGIFLGMQALLGSALQATELPSQFGSIYKISGVVMLTEADSGRQRALKQGDVVRVGDKIQASTTGEAVLRTADAGVIAIRPNASFVMERFSAKGGADDQSGLRIFSGALRLITGWTGLRNKDSNRVQTPTATIGIRGTDHEPYVMSPELAQRLQLPQASGTYNKVNRGGTTLEAAGLQLAIDAGQVGFAPAPAGPKKRALLTALMPSLLEKVPGFFVPGQFDDELEALAAHDLNEALKTLAPDTAPMPVKPAVQEPAPAAEIVMAPVSAPKPADAAQCVPADLAKAWLEQLDGAIQSRNGLEFVALFSPQVRVSAQVRNTNGGYTELHYSRSELAKSTFDALDQLRQFSSRRPTVTARLAAAGSCDTIEVESVVIESGLRAGQSYRLESLETFTLVRQSGRWLAVNASTRQR